MALTGTISLAVGGADRTRMAAPSSAIQPAKPSTPLATENDALALAAADLRTLDRETQLTTRYIWVTDGRREAMQATVFALNAISRASTPIRPVPLGKDRLLLLRVDLRAYAPRATDLQEWIDTWELLQFDPRFSLLLTRDTLRFAIGVDFKSKLPKHKKRVRRTRDKLVDVPWFEQDGKRYNQKWIEEEFFEEVETAALEKDDVIRLPSEHLDRTLVAATIDATSSQATVVSHAYFLRRALATIQDKGVAKTLYGGLYYQFAGIKTGAKKGTDEDALFEQLGVGNVEKGITAAKLFDQLRSDQRVAVFRSGVTGKPRRVDLLRTLAGRDSQSILSITHDVKDQNIDIGTHPVMNLLDFNDDARELIAEKANGFHLFALFNGQGVRQDEVPPDVATDTTIPAPHGGRLQPGISCVRCHSSEGGWRILTNDVQKVTGRKTGLDIFGDLGDQNKRTVPDTIDRLAGLYAGDLERRILPRGRNDYATEVLRATGPWAASKSQTDVVKLASDEVGRIWNAYAYDLVTAHDMLLQLGIECPKEEAAERLTKLLPPVNAVIDGIRPEDVRIAALRAGVGINRAEADLVYSFVATRVKKSGKRN